MFFTSVRDDAQADIYRYDIATKRTVARHDHGTGKRVLGDADRWRQRHLRRARRARLRATAVAIPADGGRPTVILERVRPVGYHAWADDHTLALFVLGSPNTLQLADTRTGTRTRLRRALDGRSTVFPGQPAMSFVRKVSRDGVVDRIARSDIRASRDGSSSPGGRRGLRVAARRLDRVRPRLNPAVVVRTSAGEWRQIADLRTSGVYAITRIAVSPQGNRIAFVAEGTH